jgi:hypothetical protein
MACINKSNSKYKDLQERYGDFLAESFVRGNILNKKLEVSEDFYIPTQGEVTKYFRSIRKPLKIKELEDALRLNPALDIAAIRTILQGIITKHKDTFYVIQGSNNRGPIEQQLTLKEIYIPNLNILETLSEKYPDIFELNTDKPNVTRVTITPATNVEYIPEIQSSLNAYTNLLNENEGIQPDQFIVEDHLWQRTGNHLYALIDTQTGDPFLRNMSMLSGAEVVPQSTPLDKESADAEIMDIRTNFDTEYWQIDFGLRGYNLEQIINNLEAAETQQEFDEQLATFKKITC